MNTNFFFLKLFGHPQDIPAKSRDIPPQKSFGFPGFRRTYHTFWPPPLHVEDPHPTRQYPDQKRLGLGSFFCLTSQNLSGLSVPKVSCPLRLKFCRSLVWWFGRGSSKLEVFVFLCFEFAAALLGPPQEQGDNPRCVQPSGECQMPLEQMPL